MKLCIIRNFVHDICMYEMRKPGEHGRAGQAHAQGGSTSKPMPIAHDMVLQAGSATKQALPACMEGFSPLPRNQEVGKKAMSDACAVLTLYTSAAQCRCQNFSEVLDDSVSVNSVVVHICCTGPWGPLGPLAGGSWVKASVSSCARSMSCTYEPYTVLRYAHISRFRALPNTAHSCAPCQGRGETDARAAEARSSASLCLELKRTLEPHNASKLPEKRLITKPVDSCGVGLDRFGAGLNLDVTATQGLGPKRSGQGLQAACGTYKRIAFVLALLRLKGKKYSQALVSNHNVLDETDELLIRSARDELYPPPCAFKFEQTRCRHCPPVRHRCGCFGKAVGLISSVGV